MLYFFPSTFYVLIFPCICINLCKSVKTNETHNQFSCFPLSKHLHDKDAPLCMLNDLLFPKEKRHHKVQAHRKRKGFFVCGLLVRTCISYSKDRGINNLALIAC